MEKQILELIENKRYIQVRKILEELNVVDIAKLLETIGHETNNEILLLVFRMIPKDIAAEVFAYFSYDEQQKIIEAISDKEVSQITNDLYIDDTVDFLEEMPANVVKKVLKNSTPEKRKQINQIFNYPEDSAGSIMTTEFIDIKKEMTVEETFQRIRKAGVDKEKIDFCYVTNSKRKLEGIISVREIITNQDDIKIEDIMEKNVIYINTMTDQEEAIEMFKKYGYPTMPVVDNEERLVGIITVDDVIDVIEEETTEDIEKMAALAPSENEYLRTNIFKLSKNRIIWLVLLMFTATISETIIKNNGALLTHFVILTSFIPMLMNTGGSAGAQASTLVIRGIALGQIKTKDIIKVMKKELLISILVSIALGIIIFTRLIIFDKVSMQINLVVTTSLVVTVIVAEIVGSILPIFAKSIKLDPAVMATPLITTIVDAVTLITYFGLATKILGGVIS